VRIDNLLPKAQKKAPAGTWLEYWELNAKKKAAKCSVIGCPDAADTGAQVSKPSMGPVAFIVPLCAAHSQATQTLDVAESTVFVLAKK